MRKPVSPVSSLSKNMTSLLSRLPVFSILNSFKKKKKKTSNSPLHPSMCLFNHLTSLKVYHQYVLTEDMSLFHFQRAVKFWIRVESLDNLSIHSPGYLNIMLCLWESVWPSFFFGKEKDSGVSRIKKAVLVIHSFRENWFP